MAEKNIRIGKIVNAHGIKGELVVQPLTDNNRRFRKLKKAMLELSGGRYEDVEVLSTREHKNSVLITLKGIEDRNQAERLKNVYLCVAPEDAVKPKGSYFIFELIGLEVYQDDVCYGKITSVLQNSSVDLYEVDGDFGDFYLPALKTVVKNIDLEQKRMDIEIPDGLLD